MKLEGKIFIAQLSSSFMVNAAYTCYANLGVTNVMNYMLAAFDSISLVEWVTSTFKGLLMAYLFYLLLEHLSLANHSCLAKMFSFFFSH